MAENAKQPTPVVNSYNEWDPLEEIIVGVLDGMAQPAFELPFYADTPRDHRDVVRESYFEMGTRRPEVPQQAYKELEEFVRVLEREGVKVRRPDPVDHNRPIVTPDWVVPTGHSQTCPRDVLTVIGDEIIESPMSWRSRFFEYRAYRTLLKEYFQKGARWTQAPKGTLTDELYHNMYKEPDVSGTYTITEFEPVFDAADITRCGKDIFVQKSHVTNDFGIEWLRRHLGETYNVHKLEFDDFRPIHIDATFVPLAPGKVLINPDRPVKKLPEMFKRAGWDLLEPPRTVFSGDKRHFWRYQWLLLNVLMLDEKRMIVEKEEEPFMKKARDWGFEPIPVSFRNVIQYGGGFHCFTADIRRRGGLKSYF